MGTNHPRQKPRRLPASWARAWRGLVRAFALPDNLDGGASSFAHLSRLEERTLPSATPLGTEFLINQSVAGTHQTTPHPTRAVAVDPTNGNFVVTWAAYNQNTTSAWDVYARLFNAAGAPLTNEFQVNPTGLENSVTPAVAMDGAGNFVITWASDNQNSTDLWGIYARSYNSQGKAQGPAFSLVNTGNSNEQNPTVAMDAKGDSVVAWTSDRGGSPDVYAERFNPGGVPVGTPFRVNTTVAGNQDNPAAAMDASGDFVVTWRSDQNGGEQVFAQLYDPGSGKQGGETLVSGGATAQDPAVAMDASGGYTVLWASNQLLSHGVYGRQYNSNGNPVASPFTVASSLLNATASPSIDVGPGGNYLVSWSVQGQDALLSWGVYAREMSPSGSPLGSPFLVSTTTAGDQQYSSVAADASGQAVVVWSGNGVGDGSGVFGRTVSLANITVTPASGLVTNESGGTASFQAVLDSRPTGNVLLAVTSSDPTQGTPSVSSLTFTPGNWNMPQTVTVTGHDDHIVNGDQPYTINLTASSSDPNYAGSQVAVALTNQERDVAGLQVTPASGLVTTEAGGTAQFTVALTSQPLAPVVLGVTSSDPVQGTPDVASLTFDGGNWNTPQTVTVTGHDDHIVNGDQAYAVNLAVTSAGTDYAGLSTTVALTNQERDVAGVSATPTSGLVTTESGGTATFDVVLTSEPVAPVVVGVSSSNPAQGTPGVATLTFDATNWNVPQKVRVTGHDDHIVNGDQTYAIDLSTTSPDPNYAGKTAAVTLTNRETDVAGITVTPTSGLVTTDAGGSATFQVVLTSKPVANVVVPLSSSNPQEGTVNAPALTFTPGNWATPQFVTVTGRNDGLPGNNPVAYAVVTAPAVSADPNYSGLDAADVAVVNRKTALPGVVVTPTSGLVTTEAGGKARFTVVLATQPSANVQIGLTSSDPQAGTVSLPSLVFTPSDWNVPQTVTVTGQDDHIVTPDVQYQVITAPAVSADPAYNGLDPADVSLTNKERDVAGFLVTPKWGLVTTEAGGTASLTVALRSEPVADVTLGLRSSNPSAGTLSTSALTFTAADWNVPQTVTVTGVDDHIVTGDVYYKVLPSPARSLDPVYNGRRPPSVLVTNRETDVAAILVTPTTLATTPGGTATFLVSLTSQPSAPVQVGLSSSDASAGSVAVPGLVFTAADWNVPQAVTVTGGQGGGGSATVTYTIVTAPAVSGDAHYNGLNPADVSVTLVLPVAPTPVAPAPPLPSPVTPPTPVRTPPTPVTVPSEIPTLASIAVASGGTAGAAAPAAPAEGGAGLVAPHPAARVPAEPAPDAFALPTAAGQQQTLLSGAAAPTAGVPASKAEFPQRDAGRSLAASAVAFQSAERVASDSAASAVVLVPLPDAMTVAPDVLDAAAPPPAGDMLPPLVLRSAAEELANLPAAAGLSREMTALVGTGLLASTGYVLLNTRAGFWLLSLMMAKPLWKQFDPLEVLYAWEQEERARAREDGETLQTMVE